MRRLLELVAGVALLHTTGCCHHLAGKCDCAPPVQPCCTYGLYPSGGASVLPVGAVETSAVEAAPQIPRDPIAKEKIGYPRDM